VFDREKGMVAVIAAERDCFNYRLDDPDRCSADRCLCPGNSSILAAVADVVPLRTGTGRCRKQNGFRRLPSFEILL
jgi:hypothetical protein